MNPSERSLTIEYLPLSSLKPARRNPKRHDLGTLDQSLDRFGFVAPIILDERTKRIVAGHGRMEAPFAAKTASNATFLELVSSGTREIRSLLRTIPAGCPELVPMMYKIAF